MRGFARVLEALDFQQLLWAGHGLEDDRSYQFVELEAMKPEEYDHFLSEPPTAATGRKTVAITSLTGTTTKTAAE